MIDKYREEIDKIDSRIVKLLSKRKKISLKIGQHKKEKKIKPMDKQREKEIFNRLKQKAKKENLDEKYLNRVFKMIIGHSRRIQKKI